MKCWDSVMRLFTGRACFTWIKPSVWLDKYQLGPARSQSNLLLCSGNGSQIPVKWMKRKSASGSLPRDRSERRGWKSVDPGQGSLGETDGIIIHILSVLFISSTVSCFSSSCWEKWRDPYFWAGQITLSPLGDAAAFNIVCLYVWGCPAGVSVFQLRVVAWMQGFPVEIIINRNMHKGSAINARPPR